MDNGLQKKRGAPIRKNLIGMRFGRLTVVSMAPERYVTPAGHSYIKWHCKCDCGCEVDVLGSRLSSGRTRSCGCYRKAVYAERKKVDLTGRRFGKLTVIGRSPDYFIYPSGQKEVRWICRCDCGEEYVALRSVLLRGSVRSCGCVWRCHIK